MKKVHFQLIVINFLRENIKQLWLNGFIENNKVQKIINSKT